MKLRRFLWLLVAVMGVALGGLVGLGWPAFPPDTPARPAASRAPGEVVGDRHPPRAAVPTRPALQANDRRRALMRL